MIRFDLNMNRYKVKMMMLLMRVDRNMMKYILFDDKMDLKYRENMLKPLIFLKSEFHKIVSPQRQSDWSFFMS